MALKPSGDLYTISSIRVCKKKVIIYIKGFEKFDVDYETYLNFYLYKGKKISLEEIQNIKKENENIKYFNKAINIISRGLISETNLIKKLVNFGCDYNVALNIVKKLKSHDLINDEGLIIDYLEYGKEKLYGKYKIKELLYRKGIKKEDIECISFPHTDEVKKAQKLYKNIVLKYQKYDYHSKKEKIFKKMLSMGYEKDVVEEIINKNLSKEQNNSELIQIQFEKDFKNYIAKNKNKYDNNELFKHLLVYLRRKNYSYSKIKSYWEEYYNGNDFN